MPEPSALRKDRENCWCTLFFPRNVSSPGEEVGATNSILLATIAGALGERAKAGHWSLRKALHYRKMPSCATCGNFFGARTSTEFSAPTARMWYGAGGASKCHLLRWRKRISSSTFLKLESGENRTTANRTSGWCQFSGRSF